MVVASVDSLRFRLRGFDISWNCTLRASASFMTALARLNELRLVVQLCVQYLQTHYIHSLYTEQLSKACSSQSDAFHNLTGNIYTLWVSPFTMYKLGGLYIRYLRCFGLRCNMTSVRGGVTRSFFVVVAVAGLQGRGADTKGREETAA